MPESSTGDEALPGSAEGIDNNLPGDAGDSGSADANKGAPPADSPPAEPNKDDKKSSSIADAVRAALNPEKEDSSASGDGEGESEEGESADPDGQKPKDEDDLTGDPTKEELDSWKPKTRRRFEKLTGEIKARDAELTQARPLVQRFLAIEDWYKKANLTKEDVNTGSEIMRLMKNDPMKAIDVLEPIYQQLQRITGRILPSDLQQQVTDGKITVQHAQELSRLRADKGVNVSTQNLQTERDKQQRADTARQQSEVLQRDVATAITKWENEWKSSDPDYALKQSRVNEAIELELTRAVILAKEGKPNNLPRNVEEAVKMANEVKKRVEKELRSFAPKKNTPITHVTGTGVTNGSKPVAKNMKDVVRMAVGQK